MNKMAVVKGVSAGMAAGTAVYAMSKAKSRNKHRLKARTARAIYALGDIVEGLADFIS